MIIRLKRDFARAADDWDRQIGLTIDLEAEGLDALELVAWMHDGEDEDYFVMHALPALAGYSAAELWMLWILGGMFLSHELHVQARFIARYAGLVQALEHPGDLRPDPLAEWADWRFRTPEGGPRIPTSAEIGEAVAEALVDFVDPDAPPF